MPQPHSIRVPSSDELQEEGKSVKESHLPEDYIYETKLLRFRPKLSSIISTSPSFHCILAALIMMCSAIAQSFNNTVINTAENTFRNCTGDEDSLFGWFTGCIDFSSPFKWGLAVSIFNVGALLSAPIAPVLADWISRYRVIQISIIFNVVGVFLQICFSNWIIFTVGRFISGIQAGLISIVVQVYLGEIAPPNRVGQFIAAAHAIGFGIGMTSGALLGLFFSGPLVWRALFAVSMLLSLLQGYLLPYCPHSPRWLVKKMNVSAARHVLSRLRTSGGVKEEIQVAASGGANINTDTPAPQIENELNIVKAEEAYAQKQHSWRKLFTMKNLKDLGVALFLNVSSPMTGVVAIFFFSTGLFSSIDFISGNLITLILFITYFVGSVVSMPFLGIFNRKTHLLIADAVEAFSMAVLAISFIFIDASGFVGIIVTLSTLSFLFSHSVGVGPLTGILSVEIIHQDVRGQSLSICMIASWLMNIGIGFLFPIVADLLKNFTFLPFLVVNAIMFVAFFFLIDKKTAAKDRPVSDAEKAAAHVAHKLVVGEEASNEVVTVTCAHGDEVKQVDVPLAEAVQLAAKQEQEADLSVEMVEAPQKVGESFVQLQEEL